MDPYIRFCYVKYNFILKKILLLYNKIIIYGKKSIL